MASNDMNSWDDNADEALRRRWQQTFADFEVQPRPSLRQRVLGQLPGGRRYPLLAWLLMTALVLLIGSGLVYQYRVGESIPVAQRHTAPSPSVAVPARRTIHANRHSNTADPKRVVDPAGREFVGAAATIYPHHSLKTTVPAADQRLTPTTYQLKKARFAESGRPRQHLGNEQNAYVGVAPVRAARSRSGAGWATPEPSVISSVTNSQSVGADRGGNIESGGEMGNQPLATSLVTSGALVNWSSIRPHNWTVLPSRVSTLSIPSVQSKIGESATSRSTQHHHWFIDVNPSSSFQWMSAPPTTTSHLSAVRAPAALSPATWGGQVSGGLRFRRWQTHLSIGAIRRWAYYTVYENRYHVAPSAADPHRLVRESYDVVENVVLPMVGIGINRYQFLDRGRYVVELGGQASYLPTLDQPLVGLHGGAGRRLPLSQQLDGQLGLTLDYGVNRLLNEHRQLVIHPLVVGISLRIQPRMK